MFNALDLDSGPELVAALEEADRDMELRAVILTGSGRAYAAGGNVQLMAEGVKQGLSLGPAFADIAAWLNRTVITLRRMDLPVVCAMNGVASGGGLAWALGCDLIVAARSASFDPAYCRIAVTPDGGSSLLVTSLIGHKRASEFFLLGRALSAEEALQWGLVNQVTADSGLMEASLALARKLSANSRRANALTKALMNRAVLADLERVLEDERKTIVEICQEPDFAEGIRAFFEKRKPRFT
jgi:2-(1,2-epoxy-1,2-dihydrophenyl)acetyl-CoA isomerase